MKTWIAFVLIAVSFGIQAGAKETGFVGKAKTVDCMSRPCGPFGSYERTEAIQNFLLSGVLWIDQAQNLTVFQKDILRQIVTEERDRGRFGTDRELIEMY